MSFGSFQLKESKWNTHSKDRSGDEELVIAQDQVTGQMGSHILLVTTSNSFMFT